MTPDDAEVRRAAAELLKQQSIPFRLEESGAVTLDFDEEQNLIEEVAKLMVEAPNAVAMQQVLTDNQMSASEAVEACLTAAAALMQSDVNDRADWCYDAAISADPNCAEAWYGKACLVINANGLISGAPKYTGSYEDALLFLRRAGDLGHQHAAVVEEVLRGFSAIFSGNSVGSPRESDR